MSRWLEIVWCSLLEVACGCCTVGDATVVFAGVIDCDDGDASIIAWGVAICGAVGFAAGDVVDAVDAVDGNAGNGTIVDR